MDQLSKLSKILEMYPSRQQTIRRALKIPKSSFSKLLKEIRSPIDKIKSTKWRYGIKDQIDIAKKKYIQKIIQPYASH